MTDSAPAPDFAALGLPAPVLAAVEALGYEAPTPIQARTIPALLAGRDVLGQAQTGTGKTAAFALPALTRIDPTLRAPQALVLAPTRELALQVAEAFQQYAQQLPGFQVLPVYGGQAYPPQLRALKRGPQVIVGTPGRVMDHMRSGALTLDALRLFVLDEADEMLRMGFIDDVAWILEQLPADRQIALFSATMPPPIRRIAVQHLRDPVEVTIASATTTASTIRQRYWRVGGLNRLDALTRILEVEEIDGMLVFVRTKTATVELAGRLEARGFRAAPLNGDLTQAMRENTVDRFRAGDLDVIVATDVAARGLDIDRVSHVVNFEMPTDTESYVHRIGRTGRAGRAGTAILFVAPREQGMLRAIERTTRGRLEEMNPPSAAEVNASRAKRLQEQVAEVLSRGDEAPFRETVAAILEQTGAEPVAVAAALARLAHGEQPFLLSDPEPRPVREERRTRELRGEPGAPAGRGPRADVRDRGPAGPRARRPDGDPSAGPDRARSGPADQVQRFRIEVGHDAGVRPGQIVGAIAGESGLPGHRIGHIEIHQTFSIVELPAGMPREVAERLARTRINRRPLRLRPIDD